MADPPFTYHLILRSVWDALDPSAEIYEPESLWTEGFIHCTDGEDELTATANRHYVGVPDDFAVLVLDRSRIEAPLRYDDPDRIYPHIYGPLNLSAVVKVAHIPRASDGEFLPFVEPA